MAGEDIIVARQEALEHATGEKGNEIAIRIQIAHGSVAIEILAEEKHTGCRRCIAPPLAFRKKSKEKRDKRLERGIKVSVFESGAKRLGGS